MYLALPDGELGDHRKQLNGAVLEVAHDFSPNRIFSTGRDGYDGHPDHIEAAEAAFCASALLAASGLDISVWELQSNHNGGLVIAGYAAEKLGAIAMHISQDVRMGQADWGGMDLYTPLILDGETYDSVPA